MEEDRGCIYQIHPDSVDISDISSETNKFQSFFNRVRNQTAIHGQSDTDSDDKRKQALSLSKTQGFSFKRKEENRI